jgi:hypothetical protein
MPQFVIKARLPLGRRQCGVITEQENLLATLHEQLNAMSETYKMQSQLSARYAQSSKFWRIFTLIAILVTAAISGSVVWPPSR